MNPTCPPNRFITLFACAFDPVSGILTYTNAGHNPALLVHADGTVQTLQAGGMFIALLPNLSFEEASVEIGHGDTLVLYTDGITEEENPAGEEFGMDKLGSIVVERRTWAADKLADFIFSEVAGFCEGKSPADDRTLVILRRA
jgi:serine phosphatase RsbU (regulator of sigma subunit)